MKKVLLFTFLFTLLFAVPAFAHVANEKTIYDDIEFTAAREQIVYMRGLNVVANEHGVKLFKPQDKLTKADLAFWAGTFKELGGHDAKKEDIQQAAVTKGLVDSLEGNATFANVNKAYFDGKAKVEQADTEITREQFALFMGQYLEEKIDGKTLFDLAGYKPGPSGVVEKVSSVTEGQGEQAYKVYRFTLAGQEYQISSHPKVLYGPVDLSGLEGKKIKASWLASGAGDKTEAQIIVIEQGQFGDGEAVRPKSVASNEPSTQTDANNAQQSPEGQQTQQVKPQTSFPILPVAGVIVLGAIVVWLLAKRKK